MKCLQIHCTQAPLQYGNSAHVSRKLRMYYFHVVSSILFPIIGTYTMLPLKSPPATQIRLNMRVCVFSMCVCVEQQSLSPNTSILNSKAFGILNLPRSIKTVGIPTTKGHDEMGIQ